MSAPHPDWQALAEIENTPEDERWQTADETWVLDVMLHLVALIVAVAFVGMF